MLALPPNLPQHFIRYFYIILYINISSFNNQQTIGKHSHMSEENSGCHNLRNLQLRFIDGAARLRGSAKAIDVWRLETKVEVPTVHVGRDQGMQEKLDLWMNFEGGVEFGEMTFTANSGVVYRDLHGFTLHGMIKFTAQRHKRIYRSSFWINFESRCITMILIGGSSVAVEKSRVSLWTSAAPRETLIMHWSCMDMLRSRGQYVTIVNTVIQFIHRTVVVDSDQRQTMRKFQWTYCRLFSSRHLVEACYIKKYGRSRLGYTT